jgi:hypothetical protein
MTHTKTFTISKATLPNDVWIVGDGPGVFLVGSVLYKAKPGFGHTGVERLYICFAHGSDCEHAEFVKDHEAREK